jgi:predicted RNA binding protein YcfA (HicA-like mRNA interferase family)
MIFRYVGSAAIKNASLLLSSYPSRTLLSLIQCVLVRTMSGVDSREVIVRLKAAGWIEVAHEGSHKQFKHSSLPGRVTVSHKLT